MRVFAGYMQRHDGRFGVVRVSKSGKGPARRAWVGESFLCEDEARGAVRSWNGSGAAFAILTARLELVAVPVSPLELASLEASAVGRAIDVPVVSRRVRA